jgi:class 3 adenylate cyclase/tetratricopeptide (TPR) repeat protein
MSFFEVLARLTELLQREGRVSYRAIKREWQLDDASIEDLKAELIEVRQVAVDHDAKMLVWAGDATSTPRPATAFVSAPKHTPLTFTPSHLTEKILASRAALEGERKQVTVLFADIKGSTELIEGLDPEEARKLLDPALQAMMEAVCRYEGTVNQVLGDGIMALFGAPLAHEDHALRACYAALAMQAAIRLAAEAVRRAHGVEVQIRVGLNSGEVVVRAIGNDLHMDYSAVGQTTHLAARMEQLAPPGSIRLTAETLTLVESLVQVNALGPVPVKGLTEPVEVFKLVGASPIRQRLQATAARGLTRFVGRQHELEALYQALERAGAGHGQVVALVGEPGVGKSRLLYEFTRSHRTRGWLVLESASVSYGKATAYFPVIDLLKRYFHVEDSDDPRTVRAKVTGQVLTLDEALQETIRAFLALLEVLPEETPFRALDPLQRRQRTLDALKRVLLRESQVQPLVLVFEDLHWIDTETQALLDALVESLPTARLLLLGNYRPEYQHSWGSKTYYMQLRLDPLPPANAEELLQVLLGDDTSLQPLKQLLIERTGGNPFFLEESVRTLVETQVLVGERRSYHLAQVLPSIQVPATVQAVLAARIDRLPPEEKRLLQTASVIGTEVPLPLLQAIAEVPEEALRMGLSHLQAAEFLYETRLFPELEYTFKHALTHEVAYGSLLQERRRTLHTRIVEAIEGLYPDRLTEQVERLAHHALRGEVWDKAVAYCRQAGAKAVARSANREAAAYFEQALEALPHLPDSRDTCAQAIDLRFDLRMALLPVGEYGRILEVLREAEAFAEALDDQHRLGRVSAFMVEVYLRIGEPDRAVESGQRALAVADACGDVASRLSATYYLGVANVFRGDYPRAMDLLEQTVASLDGELVRERFGNPFPPSVGARTYLAWCLAERGEFAAGMARGAEAVRIAETVDQPLSVVVASFGVGSLHLTRGDLQTAIPVLERGLELCRVWDIRFWFPLLASPLGYAYALSGQVAKAVLLQEQAMDHAAAMRVRDSYPLYAARLSESYRLTGRLEDANALARRALEFSRAHKERGYEACALRLLGKIAAHREPPEAEPAEDYYRQALTLADELGMRPLVAHCHHGLGTLYLKMGKGELPHAELSAAIKLYRAMEMTFWLPQADAALAQVKG